MAPTDQSTTQTSPSPQPKGLNSTGKFWMTGMNRMDWFGGTISYSIANGMFTLLQDDQPPESALNFSPQDIEWIDDNAPAGMSIRLKNKTTINFNFTNPVNAGDALDVAATAATAVVAPALSAAVGYGSIQRDKADYYQTTPWLEWEALFKSLNVYLRPMNKRGSTKAGIWIAVGITVLAIIYAVATS